MAKEDAAAVNNEVVADTTATESAPVENESAVTADNALDDDAFDDIEEEALKEVDTESKKQDKEEDEAEKPDDSEPADADETKAKGQPKDEQAVSPKDEWDSLKGSSQERFQQMANERREAQRRIAELEAQKAQFAIEQDLVNEINPETGEYYTPQEIERISWQQGREAQAERVNKELYESQIRENQLAINDEVAQVVKDFSVVDPSSKDYVPEIGQQYAEALNDSLIYSLPDGQQANRSTLLASGINPDAQATLVGYSTSPYKLAKLAANAYARAKAQGETIAQANAQRATEKMLANTDEPSGSTTVTTKDETSDFDEAWDAAA